MDTDQGLGQPGVAETVQAEVAGLRDVQYAAGRLRAGRLAEEFCGPAVCGQLSLELGDALAGRGQLSLALLVGLGICPVWIRCWRRQL